MLCWSLQRSCTTEPVTAPLGTSQDGVCGGTRGQRNSGIKRKRGKKNTSDSYSDVFIAIRVVIYPGL